MNSSDRSDPDILDPEVAAPTGEPTEVDSLDAASPRDPVEPLAPEAGSRDGASVVPLGASSDQQPPALVPSGRAVEGRPTYVFLGVLAAISLFLDIASKGWAEVTLSRRGFEPIELIDGHLAITLAYNQGGAWGLFANVGEHLRKPFFLVVSATAIWFIVSLYGRLARSQRALTWGLPLVLGGALGNLSDRITRSQVVDFIDYRAEWVLHTNAFISRRVGMWAVTDHWPTFNIADVAICVGVGLMAVDMFGSRKHGHGPESGRRREVPPPAQAQLPLPPSEPPAASTVAVAAD